MKTVFCLMALMIFTLASASTGSVSGTVTIDKNLSSQGTLYIYVRPKGQKRGPPLAVKRISNPKFPLSFSLSEKDAMLEGIPFEGEMWVQAKLSPSGDVMDPNSLKGHSKEGLSIKPGSKNIKINLGK